MKLLPLLFFILIFPSIPRRLLGIGLLYYVVLLLLLIKLAA